MSNAHFMFLFLFRAGQILAGGDLQVGVVALRQLHSAAGKFKQAAVIGDKAGFFFVQLFQRRKIRRAVKALGRLHRIQGAAVGGGLHRAGIRHSLAVAAGRLLDGILHRHSRCRCAAPGCGSQRRRDHGLTDKGPGSIVHRHKLPRRSQHAVFRTLGAGGPAGHDAHRLCAVRRLLFHKGSVFARHQNNFRHIRAPFKCADTAVQHRFPAQIKAELIEAHPGGGTCRHQHRRYTLFHFLHLPHPIISHILL